MPCKMLSYLVRLWCANPGNEDPSTSFLGVVMLGSAVLSSRNYKYKCLEGWSADKKLGSLSNPHHFWRVRNSSFKLKYPSVMTKRNSLPNWMHLLVFFQNLWVKKVKLLGFLISFPGSLPEHHLPSWRTHKSLLSDSLFFLIGEQYS